MYVWNDVEGVKEALTVLIDVHITFNAMSKGSKDFVMLKQGTYTFLLITFLIFNQFSFQKKFWKAET